MTQKMKRNLEEITDIIVANFDVEKIVLFGSVSQEKETSDSDIDICIISNHSERKLDFSRKVRRSLFEKQQFPMDIVIYHPSEFTERVRNKCVLESNINKYGKILYEK